MTNAIIFVPSGRAGRRWLTACAEYCNLNGYTVKHVVTEWDDVLRLLKNDSIDVVVVARREHLPSRRQWRIEAISEHTQDTLPPPASQRRPRRA